MKRETNRYLLFLQGDDHAFQSTDHSPPVSYFGWHGLPRSDPECGPRAGISIQADQNDRAFSCWRNDRHRGPYRGPAHERVDGTTRVGRQPWWCRWSDWCGLGRKSCARRLHHLDAQHHLSVVFSCADLEQPISVQCRYRFHRGIYCCLRAICLDCQPWHTR